jgi:mRNA-degrading endonuclease RelE of RelBE toxin-antitoxin system
MTIFLTGPAERQYKKLPAIIKKKLSKQFALLAANPKHPSLGMKKMKGSEVYEVRIDIHYRFRFSWEQENDRIFIISIGPHDEGLGKK